MTETEYQSWRCRCRGILQNNVRQLLALYGKTDDNEFWAKVLTHFDGDEELIAELAKTADERIKEMEAV